MVVLDVRLDNFYAFKNFHANFTYPKRIVGSSVKEEHMPDRPNFRYKKVNVFVGANASGKTTFGRVLMKIFNFIDKKNYDYITEVISDQDKEAYFALDLASQSNDFYRVICRVTPSFGEKYCAENIKIEIRKVKISSRDSYESCAKKVDGEFVPADNYMEELEKIEDLTWMFRYPGEEKSISNLPNKDERFCRIIECILKSLDPSIKEVNISQDVDSAYVIHFENKSIVLQNYDLLDTDFLSSGTKAGIGVAQILYSLMKGRNSFYYCDEKFSYIHSDVEKAVLSLMIDYIGPADQLFFTTHNTDILDMNLPKHSFTFLRKDVTNTETPVTFIDASSFLKRNTDSLRMAVENGLFSASPSVDLVYSIIDYGEECNDE